MKNVGFIGWRGMVGSVLMQRMVEERDFDAIRPVFFSTSQLGQAAPSFGGTTGTLQDAFDLEALKALDIIVTCQGGDYTNEIYPKLRESGWQGYWIDAASSLRMKDDAIIILDPVNQDVITDGLNNGIRTFVGGNCTVSLMLMSLGGLFANDLVDWVSVATYQAASGAGAPAMAELYDQTRAFLDGTPEDELEISAFAHRIAFNTIPHIDVFLDDGSTKEEWKMVVETKKIMGDPSIEVAATCVRVPVLRCHGEAINVEFAGEVTVEAARAALEAAPGVEVMDDTANKVYPMPGLLAGTDGTFVGRLRKDPTVPHGIAFWDVADQIRKGAALNAVQIAQLLLP